MKQLILSLAIIGALVATGAAEAQKAPTKKLYRWVDKDGKVQFSDSLPPEAIDQARTEMSNTGRVVADVDRALTPEEQAAAELAGKAVNAAQAQTIVQLHREIGKQQQMLIVKQAELVDADRQLAHLLERFRELKRGDAPGDTPAPTPAADAEGTPPADAPAVAG